MLGGATGEQSPASPRPQRAAVRSSVSVSGPSSYCHLRTLGFTTPPSDARLSWLFRPLCPLPPALCHRRPRALFSSLPLASSLLLLPASPHLADLRGVSSLANKLRVGLWAALLPSGHIVSFCATTGSFRTCLGPSLASVSLGLGEAEGKRGDKK